MQGDMDMVIDSQIVNAVIYNIAIAIFIVILCLTFVGIVVVIDWLLTCVIDYFSTPLDCEPHDKEKNNGQP